MSKNDETFNELFARAHVDADPELDGVRAEIAAGLEELDLIQRGLMSVRPQQGEANG